MKIELTTRIPPNTARLQILCDNVEEKYTTSSKVYISVHPDMEYQLNLFNFARFIRQSVLQTIKEKQTSLAIVFSDIYSENLGNMHDVLEALTRNIGIAAYRYDTYKTNPDPVLENVYIIGQFNADEKSMAQKGSITADGVNLARNIANVPARDMAPEQLALQAMTVAEQSTKTNITVLNQQQIIDTGLGLVAAVGQGSSLESRFIIVKYAGTNKTSQPVVLVGKGVTFDTGGLNMKPTGGIEGMHLDMSGAANCLGVLQIVQKLKLKINLVVIIPAVDNAVSAEAYHPGDILYSFSGQTVFVGNTDAEGRLVLADSLLYSLQYNPQLVIDVATLTGSALAALGKQSCAIFSNCREILLQAQNIGQQVDNRVWPMPLYPEYKKLLEQDFADTNNIGPDKLGDVCVAATFLFQFVGTNTDWLHIDMAPREVSNGADYLAAGATGEPITLLLKLIESRIK